MWIIFLTLKKLTNFSEKNCAFLGTDGEKGQKRASGIGRSLNVYFAPVLPKPPAPRSVWESSSASRNASS